MFGHGVHEQSCLWVDTPQPAIGSTDAPCGAEGMSSDETMDFYELAQLSAVGSSYRLLVPPCAV
jgi:hypothetical protein